MGERGKKKIAFISSYLPRKCGIATFCNDLINNVSLTAKGDFEPFVVAMRTGDENIYDDPVKFEIRRNCKTDYIAAAEYLNFSHVNLVCVQHEFGLFGGDGGSYLNLLLNNLQAPVVSVLHTVLDDPLPVYHKGLLDLNRASTKLITMNERGVSMLKNIYGINEEKIKLIPHGIPDLPFVDANYYKHKFGMEGRKTILSFGLLSRNKSIETMIQAMADIVKAEPSALYIVVGMTHPEIIRQEGESYRYSLQRQVEELGLKDHVIFYNRFVSDDELHNFLCAADVYVTPYQGREQLTSGTLSFAVGTGKAVVSTPYWAATELLADGRGKLVKFGDPKGMARTIVNIFQDDKLFYNLRRRAYDYGRSRIWPQIGRTYWRLFNSKQINQQVSSEPARTVLHPHGLGLPEISLEHIMNLSDDTGMYQHAKFTIPRRRHGYCTDDNARAVIAMARYYSQNPSPEVLRLFNTYLSFIMHAQQEDGAVRNFMNFDRSWMEGEPEHDALGRVLWAFGTVMKYPPSPVYMSIIKDCFDRSVQLVPKQHPRSVAYSILGMACYLEQFPGASDIKRCLKESADLLVERFEICSRFDWQWFEEKMTYENAVLPNALFHAGLVFENPRYLYVAQKSCDFLLSQTLSGDMFSFVGCNGWHKAGGVKACFDQQPIEAAGTVMMLNSAYEVTGSKKYLRAQKKAFDWFLGVNELRIPLYDFRTKGCYDGLMSDGVNINQGAESCLCYTLALLEISGNYAAAQKPVERKDSRPILLKTESLYSKKGVGSVSAASSKKSKVGSGQSELIS